MSMLLTILAILGKIGIFLGILQSATEFTNVEYTNADGDTLYAYLATPPGYDSESDNTYPTALVFHAWNGMGDEPVYFADLLAAEGYIVLAPDLFRGVSAPMLFIPWNIISVVTAPQSRMDADVNTAISYLDMLGTTDMDLLVSGPGFCFGGSQALELARRRSVAATVSLYGSSIAELNVNTTDEDWGMLGADGSPILGIFGEEDNAPSPEAAMAFQEALEQRDIVHNVTIYPGVGHGFVRPTDHASGETQVVEAWEQVVEFLTNVATNGGRDVYSTRRVKQATKRPRAFHHSLSWVKDHATDLIYHKGHAAKHKSYGG